MAQFRTHIAWGAVLGVALVVVALIFPVLSAIQSMLLVFVAVLVGSFLPDLDLDDGLPFQILFGIFGISAGGAIFFILRQNHPEDIALLLAVPIGTFLFVRYVLGYIFKKFTRHRGMFHSIPAAVLFGLLTLWVSESADIFPKERLFIAAAVAAGYLGHLVLDEIYSAVNLHGIPFLPKKSLGSALKLYSSSWFTTVLFYVIILVLTMTLPETRQFLLKIVN